MITNSSLRALHPGQWFERPFAFEHLNISPAGVLERLRYTPLRLRDQIKDIAQDQLTLQPEGQWSIQENAGHLLDLEPLWYGRLQEMIGGVEIMRAADLQNRKTHEANHNAIPMEQILDAFESERDKMVRLCTENHTVLMTASALHPRLQTPMRMIDLMYFVAEHDDHHLATIRYLMDEDW